VPAGFARVTVPVVLLPPGIEVGDSTTLTRLGLAVAMERVSNFETVSRDAVIVAEVATETGVVVITKLPVA
jgi:hypothetical protein